SKLTSSSSHAHARVSYVVLSGWNGGNELRKRYHRIGSESSRLVGRGPAPSYLPLAKCHPGVGAVASGDVRIARAAWEFVRPEKGGSGDIPSGSLSARPPTSANVVPWPE